MKKKKSSEEKQEGKPKKSFLSAFLRRQEPDKTYMSDLKFEWQNMNQKERLKFVLGAVFGLILFFSALTVVYIILSSMMR